MELKRGSILGQYELLARIGKGGMASVWVARTRATATERPRIVAIKAMLPDLARNMKFRAMFLEEGQTVRSIDHSNIVKVQDVGETDGILFMAMEWVEGDSLHAIIAEANKRRPIPAEVAARVIADTAAGLHAAHEVRGWDGELKNLVHCDVSPHNILVGQDGAVKLVDFGVASAVGQLGFNEPGTVRGKFGYMSPEQTRGEKLDRRSDVFSLGIVLFELTTGRRLFKGEDTRQTVEMVRRARIPGPREIISDYPAKLEDIVLRALERDRYDRYQTAEELKHALEQYLVSERIVVPRGGVAGLLKRVLRDRIEQRRDSIRAAVLELDGSSAPDLPPVTAVYPREEAGSEPSAVSSHSASQPSMGAAQLSEHSAGPQTLRPASSLKPVRRIRAAHVATALVVAAIAFWLGRVSPRESVAVTTMQDTLQPEPGAERAAQTATVEAPAGTSAAVSLDSLPIAGQVPPPFASRNQPREQAARTEASAKPGPSAEGSPAVGSVNLQLASDALRSAAERARLCRRPGEVTGPGKVRVTFAASGQATAVELLGKYAGTLVGECVAQKFRRATVPSFTGDAVVLQKSFELAE